MFVDKTLRPGGEVKQGLKMSEAIRAACSKVSEADSYTGCAIATAYLGRTGKELVYAALDKFGGTDRGPGVRFTSEDLRQMVADEFGAPLGVVESADARHHSFGQTRLQVAEWLEGQGY